MGRAAGGQAAEEAPGHGRLSGLDGHRSDGGRGQALREDRYGDQGGPGGHLLCH